jgi:site-specific DNA-methyltransferase (adenine-specific)/modification methylase
VSALLEGRNFIGIEKNEDVALFKRDEIDYIDVSKKRLHKAWLSLAMEKRKSLYVSPLITEFGG